MLSRFQLNLPVKHNLCRPGHKEPVTIPVPEDGKIAPEKVYRDRLLLVSQSVYDGSRGSSAGSGPAGKGLAGASFPYTHGQFVPAGYLDEFGVDSFREDIKPFKITQTTKLEKVSVTMA